MIKRLLIIIILLVQVVLESSGQEIITGLSENPVIIDELARMEKDTERNPFKNREDTIRLLLPFFDDFKQSWIFPSELRWSDNYAYINNNFGYHSANRGVATLDAIDNRGKLHKNASTFPFGADSLTSQRIRLDSIFSPIARPLSPADSIYLSFFYQPQGRGNAPEFFDSLILDFGYYTGRQIFSGYYDSISVPLSAYIQPGDTVFPGDTLYSPSGQCAHGLFVISNQTYTYNDEVVVPCDSVKTPEYKWKEVWASGGMTLVGFDTTYGTYSRQVLIPVTDSSYFSKDFRFRFRNYASLALESYPSWRANCDQWNIDYVYLNRNRSKKDTTYRDVSFAERAPSILKSYEAMPYRQYVNDPTNELKDNLELFITNLDSTTYNTNFYYAVYELNGSFQYQFPGGNCNLAPFYQNGYQDCISCAAHACPPANFLFPLSSADSAEFETRYYIIGDITPVDTVADTLKFRQKFYNYYAYDDGSPEAGFGATPAGSKIAYQFKLNVKDTLRAVQIYFNRAQNNANEVFFDLVVWRDNNGVPGEIMYTQPMQRVKFSETLNQFQIYFFDDGIPVNGTFYIGTIQSTGDNLNIGYDRYNNAQVHIFTNTQGVWEQSPNEGALMMRPLIGKRFSYAGVEEPVQNLSTQFTLYPNPVNGDIFYLRYDGAGAFHKEDYAVRIYSLLGQVIYQGPYQETFHSVLPGSGVYLLQLLDKSNKQVFSSKIIKH